MSFIDHMYTLTAQKLDYLYRGVDHVIFTDFPDYPNVGDSAIALGNLTYWQQAGVGVESVYALTTLAPSTYRSTTSVVINGGGNLGGLYPPISSHRYTLAERLQPETLLIQASQSVDFVSEVDRMWFTKSMAARPNMRIAVRDANSLKTVGPVQGETLLCPDSAHMLGAIASPPPAQTALFLARRDDESAVGGGWTGLETVDWPTDFRGPAAMSWLRWRLWRFMPRWKAVLNNTPAKWQRLATRRLERGLNILSRGEIVVTDRLHAMLLALHMGREVVAIDNANRKLSNYAETWFGNAQPALSFVKSVDDAQRKLSRGSTISLTD